MSAYQLDGAAYQILILFHSVHVTFCTNPCMYFLKHYAILLHSAQSHIFSYI